MITIKTTKDFSISDIKELFRSVGWDDYKYPEIVVAAMKNSTNVISAWDGNKLVGIIRSLDDGYWSANIDCFVVHADFQHRGIGSSLLKELLNTISNITYINVSPNESINNSFYEQFGFEVIEGSNLLQKVNIR